MRTQPLPPDGAALAREGLGSPAQVLAHHGVSVHGRVARCPFHEDRTPSLSIYTARDGVERWGCFACGARGDAIDLEALLSKRSVAAVIHDWTRRGR